MRRCVSLTILVGLLLCVTRLELVTQTFSASAVDPRSLLSPIPPATEWNRTFGGPSWDDAVSVKQTEDGGYVVAGLTGSFGGKKAWLAKTDSSGVEIWNRTYGGVPEIELCSLVQTSDGYLLAGYARSPLDGKCDAWLVKTDLEGNVEWDKTYERNEPNTAFSAHYTDDGGYVAAGGIAVGESYGDFYLFKTDAFGNMEWSKTYGSESNGEGAESVVQAADGGYLLAGHIGFPDANTDAWMVKTDRYGNLVWNKTIGRVEGRDYIHSAQRTTDGGYILAGATDIRNERLGSGEFWLVKIDANGNVLWNRRFGDVDPFYGIREEAFSACQTTEGGFVVVGVSYGGSFEGNEISIIKTDALGNKEWNQTFGGKHGATANYVVQTNDRGYAIAGTIWVSTEVGERDFWLIKMMRANPPVAQFSCDRPTPTIHEALTFNASSCYDLDQDIVTYRWDFDDGNVSSIPNPIITHVFESPGIYNVTLTVIDSEGLNSSLTQLVWVRIITSISVSASLPSTFVGFPVNVTGALNDVSGGGLKNETINIQSSKGGYTWTLIGEDTSDSLGRFSFTWTPIEKGSFQVKAEWAGNQTFYSTANTTGIQVLAIPTDVSITLSSSTSLIGFRIDIGGNLTSDVGPLSHSAILLSYSVTGGQTWNEITLTHTASEGSYSTVWLPQATGNYLVKAVWAGNYSFPGTTATVNLAVTPYGGQNVFAVESNSTISNLAFDTASRRLSFTVAGENNTVGYARVSIAKTLIADITKLEINIDGVDYHYSATETENSWVLLFTYPHSTHNVIIDLHSAMSTGGPLNLPLIYLIPLVAAIALVVGIVVARRLQKSPKATMSDASNT